MIKSFHTITHSFLTAKFLKYKVSRLPGEEFVALLPEHATLSDLFSQITNNFQLSNSHLLASPAFTFDLASFPVNQEIKEANENLQDQPFLPLLLGNDLYVYEVSN